MKITNLMAESQSLAPTTSVSTVQQIEAAPSRSPNVVLKLRKPKNDKKVAWKQGTVDNEFMNKKKSKCCCIYEKPRLFGESSSDESDNDDCTNNCRGHKKKCFNQADPPDDGGGGSSDMQAAAS